MWVMLTRFCCAPSGTLQHLDMLQDVHGSTMHLGKGVRCAPPLHPPRLWLDQGIEPRASQQTYQCLIPRR